MNGTGAAEPDPDIFLETILRRPTSVLAIKQNLEIQKCTCVSMQVSGREEPASASSRQEQPPQDRPTSTRTAVTCQLQV
jgi:hypothetical protein